MTNQEADNRLGQRLLEAGKINSDELEKALKRQESDNQRIGKILLEMGLIEEDELLEFLGRQTGYMVVNLDNYPVNQDVVGLFSYDQVKNYHVAPLFQDDESLTVAMRDPLDLETIDDLKMITNFDVQPAIATESEIERYIDRAYKKPTTNDRSSDREIFLMDREAEDEKGKKLDETDDHSPSVKIVNRIIRNALQRDVSYIHVDPRLEKVKVLFRIYGLMRHFSDLPLEMGDSIISRFEVLADQSGSSVPTEGEAIRLRYGNELVTLRLEKIETQFGEKLVVQIRRESLYQQDLSELGLDTVSNQRMKSLLDTPRGLVLFTGPEESGKKTTLYTSLRYLSSGPCSIVTIEDPVDFELGFCSQIQVPQDNPEQKAEGVQEALRADPDILMVSGMGEGRVAKSTLDAAATGRKVLSTFHADNSLDAIYHLTHREDIDRFLLANTLIGVISQRLVRVPRDSVIERYQPSSEVLSRLDLPESEEYYRVTTDTLRKNPYEGVTGIFQILPITNQLRRCILEKKEHSAFEKAKESIPLESLRQKGAQKVLDGETTIDEVLRVSFREDLTEHFTYPGDS